MPDFSQHSLSELETCHQDLQKIAHWAIDWYNFRVIEGYRSKERQNKLYQQDKSQLQYLESNHNTSPSEAIDVAPWPIDWQAQDRFYQMSGVLLTASKVLFERGETEHLLRWGGDWDGDYKFDDNDFDDLPHFELITQ